MLEVAYILVALALIVFLVYLIITVQKLGRVIDETEKTIKTCLLYTSPSPRDVEESRMPSSA